MVSAGREVAYYATHRVDDEMKYTVSGVPPSKHIPAQFGESLTAWRLHGDSAR